MRVDRFVVAWLAWVAGLVVVFALRFFAGVPATSVVPWFVLATMVAATALILAEGYRATAWAADHHQDKPFRLDWRPFSVVTVTDDFGDPELRKRIDDYLRARRFLAWTTMLCMLLGLATFRK